MQRPNWWEFNSAGKYLYEQYKYVRANKKTPMKKFVTVLGFKNRSSLYNIFTDHNRIDPNKIEDIKTLFYLNETEAEYILILTFMDLSNHSYAQKVWKDHLRKFLRDKEPPQSVFKDAKTGSLFDMWENYKNMNEFLGEEKKEKSFI